MKLILITMGLSRIVEPLVKSEHDVVGIIECAPRKKVKIPIFIRMLGVIKRLFIRNSQTLFTYSKNEDIPYLYMNSSDQEGLEKWIRDKQPDVIVVFSMSQLLKENVFSIPPLGTINLHPAYLPDYRGPNPDFWQYYNMELNPGVTVHFIDQGEDTGDILLQERASIPLGMKSKDHLDLMIGDVGVRLLLKALALLSEGNVKRLRQENVSPTVRARNISLDEHRTIVDWQEWPAERVWHLLRGTEGWLNAIPQPEGLYKGQRWVVGELEAGEFDSDYGVIKKVDGEHYLIVRNGRIRLSILFRVKNAILGFING